MGRKRSPPEVKFYFDWQHIAADIITRCDNHENGLSEVLNPSPSHTSNILYLVEELAFTVKTKYETKIKEHNSFKVHFKVGKGLKIFKPSEYLETCLFQLACPHELPFLLLLLFVFIAIIRT